MTEEEVFDLLDGGWINKRDHRGHNAYLYAWECEIGDKDGDLSCCYGKTPESAWDNAVAQMIKSLQERANENREANEPTLSAWERNPGL